ncbi:MAG: DUF177 domain-containing protein [Prevotella sp.]|nr:DUF177 domain-containing protein [Prevotella sp.]
MCSMDSLNVDLKSGEASLHYNLDDTYFSALEGAEVNKGNVEVSLEIAKSTEKIFNLSFHIIGEVTVECDRCLDEMQQPIDTEARFVVKLGQEVSDSDDVLMVAEDNPILNITWPIYETIALAIPIKHVHAPGKCNSVMLKKLEEHSAAATRSSDEDEPQDIDPRWSKLAGLNFDNKN